MEFGRLKHDTHSSPRSLPLINPSTMPLKGVVFATGEMNDIISTKIFELEKGQTKYTTLQAYSGNVNGSFNGEIMVYSSPFWLLFPNDFINSLLDWNAELTVFILDVLAAVILTSFTMVLLLSITIIGDTATILVNNRSWQYPARLIIKKNTVIKIKKYKLNLKEKISKGIGWILRIEFSEEKFREKTNKAIIKPLFASLVLIPIFYFLDDGLLGMFIAVLIGGVIAYYISCKLRVKIVLATVIAMSLSIANLIIQSNLTILGKEQTNLEHLTFIFGAAGIYILLFSLLLIPFALISWHIVKLIRNLKEQKDPLLSMEGRCDL